MDDFKKHYKYSPVDRDNDDNLTMHIILSPTLVQDDAGNYITPGYDFEKAPQYEANAIEKYGSLEAAREAYNSIGGPPMKSGSALYAKLTASCKAAAKKKFKVYPSAYANMWASKQQKKGKC